MRSWKLPLLLLGCGMASLAPVSGQENQSLSLKDMPVGIPTAAIIPACAAAGLPHACRCASPIPGPETDLPFKDLVAAGIVKRPGGAGAAGQGAVLGHAGRQRRRASLRNLPFQRRRGQPLEEPDLAGTARYELHRTVHLRRQPFRQLHGAVHRARPAYAKSARPERATAAEPRRAGISANSGRTTSWRQRDFPLNGWLRPTERTPRGPHTPFLEEFANVSRDTNDVISSQGVRHTVFTGVMPGNPVDQGTPDARHLQPCLAGTRSTRTPWCGASSLATRRP